MTTIWKATLKQENVQDVPMPDGAHILCAREQGNDICVWFRCDPKQPMRPRRIAVVGTGHPAPDTGNYLGSASLMGGSLIFHVFETTHIH